MTSFSRLAAALAFILAPTSSMAEEGHYLAVIIGSQHFGNENLNNVNPGLLLGKRWDSSRPGTEWFVEGGVFYNSYEEVSPMLLFGVSTKITETGPVEWRIGGAVGTAYYKEQSVRLKEAYGIPNVGGYIPVALASVAARIEDHEVRLTAVPPDEDTSFILNLSYTHSF